MKQVFITILLVFLFGTMTFSQTSPQFGFNAVSDYSSFIDSENEYSNYLMSVFLLAYVSDMSNEDKLRLCYRKYEYEHTSMIVYATVNDEPLPLRESKDTALLSEKTPVNFGSSLEDNDKVEEEEDSVIFALWFASPVTKIDPAIFSATVKSIVFPPVSNLEYCASSSSCVRNLIYIEGRDVIDNELLVSREGELIVAAVAGRNDYILPKEIIRIGAGSFRGCTLKEIYLPSSVNYIGDKAFDLCDNLTAVTITSPEPIEISSTAFSDAKGMKYKIYVPKSCVKSYRSKYPQLKKRIKELKVQ